MTDQHQPSPYPWRNSIRWLALAGLVGVLAAGCGNGEAKDKEGADAAKNATVPVEVQPLKRAEMVAVYSGTAPIEAHEEATVVAKVGGEVRQIFVEEGDAVQAGQVLARLDGDRLRLTLAQTDANLRKLERDYKRTLELAEKGLVPKSTAENTRYDLDALRAGYDSARLELSYTEIRAPINGVISARKIKVGNTIGPNDPTFTVTDLDPLLAFVHVPEKEFRKIAPGQNAEVVIDALGGARFNGTISRISPTVDPQTGTFRARVEVPDATRTLKPGMFARVNIVYERRQAALQLPRTAILDADGQQSVFVVASGKAEQRPIRTGLANGGWIEVLDGLEGSEQVVTVGQAGLKTGTLVKIVGDGAPQPAAAVAAGQAKAK
ncbi:MAG: efflux RND transporter periplasmic adaptor subunit [Gammaproteobacteria bacterium]|nr:efflux RND transporter periplasmic adaptor subunit [Gammaproteobacteria bacterium]MDH4312282.1 efflux RND transporter periplasmic adaptor subunit [Gammaproteobacteria bacterium]MDH5272486.1 efflux RND transporter periplasmic adaptor subunit [Gammaproteobacteria bacterium]